MELLDDRSRLFEQHHPLTERRVIGFWNQRVLPFARQGRLLDERVRNQSADGISGRRKLRRLGNRVTEDQPGPNRVPQSVLPQSGFGRTPIRRHIRVRDRKTRDVATSQQAGQAVEALVDDERRAWWREDYEAADGVHDT